MSVILLLGGGLQTLSVARGLNECGHTVVNCGDSHAVGRFSNFVDKYYQTEIGDLSIDSLESIIQNHNVALIIPTEDEYAEWLSKHKNEIESLCNVKAAVESSDLFAHVIDKNELLVFCKTHDIPHPKTDSLTIDNIEEAARTIGFPALIKPNVSNGSRGIHRVENIEELHEWAPKIINDFGECTLQEFISQPHYYNVMLYRYADGSFSTCVATKITRFYPIKGGSSSFCTTIDNQALFEPCKRLLNELNWVGFADFDVLEKDKDDFRIIEINPRVPASIHAAYASGVNFGQIIAEDMLNGRKIFPEYHPGEQLRFLGLDIAWFLASPMRFKTSPSWFKFFGKHLHYQEGGLKDWRAMAYSIYTGIRKQLSPSFRKQKAGMN